MSQQLTIRFYGNQPESDYESNLLSKGFDLLESLKDSLGAANFLAAPMTSNEEELIEIIEEELGGEPDDEDEYDEFEENIEKELGIRGEFFSASGLLEIVRTYQNYFNERSTESFDLASNRHTTGESLAEDLQDRPMN